MRKYVVCAAFFAALASQVSADTIAIYTFEGQSLADSAGAAHLTASDFSAVLVSNITFVTGRTPFWAYNASNWPSDSTAVGYYTFTITPDPTYAVNLTDVTFDAYRSSTGPQSLGLEYSMNGGANWTELMPRLNVPSSSTWYPGVGATGLSVNNLASAVQFRIFGVSSTGSAGTFRVDNVTAQGSVIPEPMSAALTAAGVTALALLRRRRRTRAARGGGEFLRDASGRSAIRLPRHFRPPVPRGLRARW